MKKQNEVVEPGSVEFEAMMVHLAVQRFIEEGIDTEIEFNGVKAMTSVVYEIWKEESGGNDFKIVTEIVDPFGFQK